MRSFAGSGAAQITEKAQGFLSHRFDKRFARSHALDAGNNPLFQFLIHIEDQVLFARKVVVECRL